MGVMDSLVGYIKGIVHLDAKVTTLTNHVERLGRAFDTFTEKYSQLSERIAKLEGKFEAYENVIKRASKSSSSPRKQLDRSENKALDKKVAERPRHPELIKFIDAQSEKDDKKEE